MGCAGAAFLVASLIGLRLTQTRSDGGYLAFAVVWIAVVAIVLAIYWHETDRHALRDATLTIPWAGVLAAILPFPVMAAARVDLPLQDALLARIDGRFGVSVPRIVAWAGHHLLGHLVNQSYRLLIPWVFITVFAPALAGRVRASEEFIAGNLMAFAIAVPLFAVLPAVGPWYFYHSTASHFQALCQSQLFALRVPGAYVLNHEGTAIICFPSFHVIWAILCARAFWGFRRLRLPTAMFATSIILSTLTTGWHYFADVLAGVVVATASIYLSDRLFLSAGTPSARQLDMPPSNST